jgi:hypothetical protein
MLHNMGLLEAAKKSNPLEKEEVQRLALELCRIKKLFSVDIEEKGSDVRAASSWMCAERACFKSSPTAFEIRFPPLMTEASELCLHLLVC